MRLPLQTKRHMSKNCKITIRLISAITLAAFLSVQTAPGYALDSGPDHFHIRSQAARESTDNNANGTSDIIDEMARAMAIGRLQAVANANGAQADKKELYLQNLAEAVSFHIKMRYRFYPQEHPLFQYLQAQLQRIAGSSSDVKIFLIRDVQEMAFALPNGEICISSGMLKMISTEEELSALLMHEYRHIEAKHALKSLSSLKDPLELGEVRLHEFEADVAMMIELDKRGINPYGAILLAQRFRQEVERTRPKTAYHSRWEVETHDLDITHGSAMQRELNLRELARIYDFRCLSTETRPLSWDEYDIERFPKMVLTGIDWSRLENGDFWNRFGIVLQYSRRNFDGMPILENFLHGKSLGLTQEEQAALTVFIYRYILGKDQPFTITINGQERLIGEDDYSLFRIEAIQKLFDTAVFDKLGLKFFPSDLIKLSEVVLREEFKETDADILIKRCGLLARLRQTFKGVFEARFGRQSDFTKR